MKNNKFLILSLGTLMCLTACGGGGGTVVDQDLPTDDPTSEVEINFWHCLGHAKTDNLTKIVDKFNTEYAGKYRVKLTHLAGDYDTLHDALKTKLASGEIPALTMGYPDSFSEYITKDMSESSILRLDNFINDPNYGYSAEELADFVPGFFAEGTGYQFEGTWSMPMYKSTEAMYYNKQYFAGSNVLNEKKFAKNDEFLALNKAVKGKVLPAEADLAALKTWVKANNGYAYEVPTTWTQLFQTADQMKKDRATEGIKEEFYPVGYDSDANMLISQMKQRGIAYTVNDEESKRDSSKHFKFNNPEAKALVQEIIGYINDKLLITKNSLGGSTYTNTYFNESKTAMAIGSTGGSSYNISANFGVGLAAVPYSNNNPQYIQQGPSICFFDNLNGYVHKGAWLFYKTLAQPENNAVVALENSYDPVRISSYNTDAYKTWIGMAGKGLKYDIPNITSQLKDHYMVSPTFVGSGEARRQVGNLITYVYQNHYTIDESFERAINQCKSAA